MILYLSYEWISEYLIDIAKVDGFAKQGNFNFQNYVLSVEVILLADENSTTPSHA